mgnify:CR=1 FL=1
MLKKIPATPLVAVGGLLMLAWGAGQLVPAPRNDDGMGGPAEPPLAQVLGTTFALTWRANEEPDLFSYSVERATNPGGPYTSVATSFGAA